MGQSKILDIAGAQYSIEKDGHNEHGSCFILSSNQEYKKA